VAANMTALGQFQLLKVLSPVMVMPCPAASDTTYFKIKKQNCQENQTFDLKTESGNFSSKIFWICSVPETRCLYHEAGLAG